MTGLDRHQKATRYTAHGLPPGITCDPATGRLSGRPQITGRYTITVTQTAVLAWPWSWLRRLRLTRGSPAR